MSGKVISFPGRSKTNNQQHQVDAVLMQDPKYKFIHDLVSAVHNVGFPLDKEPDAKAREIYAMYLRQNKLDKWSFDVEV